MELSPATSRSQRALAAIVLTDAVGFSARMSVDEEGTLALIQRDLELISRLCDRYEGQVLKSTGDGLLMSFVSAVQAVSCSQEIQKELAHLADGLPPGEYLQHRIGIHLGDVLFSHSDVLGNGVNIAARLQTQSSPGGICISQTVYDVVKARLDLHLTFLGPLRLKNIKEPVPAYEIPPVGQTETVLKAAEPSTPDYLTQAIAALQNDPNARRIKKLIFGTCKNTWENDPTVLAQFELQGLINKLLQRYDSLDALETGFNAIIARLNRQGEYLAVASRILAVMQPVYEQRSHEGETAETETAVSYQSIAAYLEQNPERLRIKKLLYAIVHETWENNPRVLNPQEMTHLVEQLHDRAPTAEDLTYHLDRIIKRLNRQDRYREVARFIGDALQPLYAPEDKTVLSVSREHTMPLTSPTMLSTQNSGGTGTTGDLMTTVTRLESLDSFSADETMAQPPPAPPPNPALSQEPRSRNRANLYSLRLEIMRYTNPLRAKILLLSTVRSPFAFTPQDWLTLKTKTLDELLQETFTYCTSYADLESKLTIISHCLENADDNAQAASTILKAMKPFYPVSAASNSTVSPT